MRDLPSMFDAASATSREPPGTNYIQPNLGHALRIWWAFYWPNTLISSTLGFGLGYLLRLAYENTNVPGRLIRLPARFGDLVLTYAVAIFVIQYILGKRFRDFRIGLLSRNGGTGAQLLQATFRRTLRVWWTFSWRTVVYYLIAWVVVILPLGWFLGVFRPSPTFAAIFLAAIGFVVGGAVALFAIYSNILDEDIGDFRVCLLRHEAQAAPPANAAGNAVGL